MLRIYTSALSVNNRHVRDDTVGVSTEVSVMSVVQSELKFSPCSRNPVMVYYVASRDEVTMNICQGQNNEDYNS